MPEYLLYLALSFALSEYERKLDRARELFYQEEYAHAAQAAEDARRLFPEEPLSYEIRSTALLFILRRCADCEEAAREFERDVEKGLDLARNPQDARTRFLRAKLLLNRVWFRGGVRGERSWGLAGNIKEAKSLLNAALHDDPGYVRARTARGMVEYQIGRRIWYERMLVGGGDREKGFRELRENAACADCGRFDALEARFALLDALKSEKLAAEAQSFAGSLLLSVPDNPSLLKFLNGNGGGK